MCGICGFISKKNISMNDLARMNDTMVHRGPDDYGTEIYVMKHGYSMGLAQRRLAIMDLSQLGHQPMHSPDRRISVVYNGEIYNFKELKEELCGEYQFISNCDTEVIIAAYLKWGIDSINRFNGMFAIALYDREKEDFYLVRDRIGKKPLYYYHKNGELVFGSELKPIMHFPGFETTVKREIVPRYLYHQYINAPDTIFDDVYKLEPGCILHYYAENISISKYWDIADTYQKMQADPVTDYKTAKAELKELLIESVRRRMIADVPLGSFLSGGYDSSLITALAQDISDKPVKTFCIGFDDEKYNEAPYAKAIAEHLGTEHTEMFINENEMFKLVQSIPQYFDEPFADSSQIPTMLVSKLAKSSVTVSLSGDGGDEFFCGYNLYENVAQAKKLDGLGAVTHAVSDSGLGKLIGMEEKLPFKVRTIAYNRDPEAKTQFGLDNYAKRALLMVGDTKSIDINYRFESKYEVDNWQTRRMLLDMDTYLPGDILCKVDRASMKYSLETRCPIMDPKVMEYSFRLPHSFKYHHGDKKHILKDIAYDYIPKELLERPKKGFSVPMDKWLRGPLRAQLMDYTNIDFLKRQGIFDPEYTSEMIRSYINTGDGGAWSGANYSKLCWSFLQFQEWYIAYINR